MSAEALQQALDAFMAPDRGGDKEHDVALELADAAARFLADRPTYYAVTVVIEHHTEDGWTGARLLPPFLLNARMLGILCTERAAGIACDIVSGLGLFESDSVAFHVNAVEE